MKFPVLMAFASIQGLGELQTTDSLQRLAADLIAFFGSAGFASPAATGARRFVPLFAVTLEFHGKQPARLPEASALLV